MRFSSEKKSYRSIPPLLLHKRLIFRLCFNTSREYWVYRRCQLIVFSLLLKLFPHALYALALWPSTGLLSRSACDAPLLLDKCCFAMCGEEQPEEGHWEGRLRAQSAESKLEDSGLLITGNWYFGRAICLFYLEKYKWYTFKVILLNYAHSLCMKTQL